MGLPGVGGGTQHVPYSLYCRFENNCKIMCFIVSAVSVGIGYQVYILFLAHLENPGRFLVFHAVSSLR